MLLLSYSLLVVLISKQIGIILRRRKRARCVDFARISLVLLVVQKSNYMLIFIFWTLAIKMNGSLNPSCFHLQMLLAMYHDKMIRIKEKNDYSYNDKNRASNEYWYSIIGLWSMQKIKSSMRYLICVSKLLPIIICLKFEEGLLTCIFVYWNCRM